jgi:hypothetical protein
VAARIGLLPSDFHPVGGVHFSPATDSASREATRKRITDKERMR